MIQDLSRIMHKKKKLTFLISDSIEKGEIKRSKSIFKGSQDDDFSVGYLESVDFARVNFVRFLTIAILAIFFARLFTLTVVSGEKYRNFADENRIRIVDVEAKRGRILDRDGKVIASSQENFFLVGDTGKVQISSDQAKELEKEGLAGENFTGDLGKISREVVRVYPYGEVFAHVVGYTSLVQENDVSQNAQLYSSEFVGRLGVEESYDQVLRGVNGKKIVEVDSVGKTISILDEVKAKDGQDVALTVDADLQKRAFDAMGAALLKLSEKSGSLIVTNPQNGEVLTLLSFPSFDPAEIGKFVTDEEKPLFNRAISGNYAPGSVFKIVSSIAGLESGKFTKDTEVEDVGVFELGGVKFPNWYYLTYGQKDGVLKMDRAIARSNDIFFFRLGEQVGLDILRKWAINLGFGQKTGIDLPGETSGLVPDESWKLNQLNETWFLGDTMHLAIGQGFMITSPLQINVMTEMIANGGKKIAPHVVLSVVSSGGEDIMVTDHSASCHSEFSSESDEDDKECISSANLEIVKSGMRQACREKGTAWPFFKSTYEISCKTGTAEKAQGNPHAWFTAYAPSALPEVAITVMIENGGEGSSVAAPVAREILDWYFQIKN